MYNVDATYRGLRADPAGVELAVGAHILTDAAVARLARLGRAHGHVHLVAVVLVDNPGRGNSEKKKK